MRDGQYGFSAVTGSGLGISYSSLSQLGQLLPFREVGQAKLKCYLNVANGNMMLQDHAVPISELSGPVNLFYFYNSQAASPAECWRLSGSKLFAGLPDPKNPVSSVTLTEEDGHQTTYQYDSSIGAYVAPGLQNGTPYLYYDYHDNINQWVLYHPGTYQVEYYNQTGYLQKRFDLQGRMTSFEYDDQNQLSAIVGPSGCRYEIRRQSSGQNTVIEFYAVEESNETLLQICTFDNLGRLVNTSPGDPSSQRPLYSIEYQYYGDTTQLLSVQQTDNTFFGFNYDEQNRIERCNVGNQAYNVNYNSPNSSSFIDGYENKTDFVFDNNARLQQLIQQRGYESYINPPDVTNYIYALAGQIASIQRPDEGIEKFEYSDILGQQTRHVLPNGQVTEFYYHDTTTDRPKLRNKVQYLGSADNNNESIPAITSYVYNDDFDNQDARHSFLCFEISPEGRVTEYRPDSKSSNPKSIRTYSNGLYTAPRPVQVAPTLGEMQDWVAQQNPQQISLTDFDYTDHGQPQEIKQYARIDAEGNGIEGVDSSQTNFNWDLLGGWISKQIRQQGYGVIPAINTRTTQKFDSLHRLANVVEFMDADGKEVRETKYEYNDTFNGTQSQFTTIYPNQRAEIKLFNVQGQLDSKEEKVGLQSRVTLYNRDSGGRVNEVVHPDGMITYTLYDKQERLGFIVDVNGIWDQDNFNPQGIITQFDYDRVHRYKKTTRYAQAINIKDWVNEDQYNPEASYLIPLLNQNDPRNRCTYEFYDASNRLSYQVDEEQYFIEFRYDNLNQLIGKIAYQEKLASEQMQALLQGQSLNLKPDPNVDRWTQYFYDADSKKIGEQDPAGYVTQYLRDAGGRIQEKIIYFNPTEHKADFKDVLPPPNPEKDAHTFYFYDARGQCTHEIDAEGYYTEHEYMACGLPAKSRRYANKFDSIINKNLPQAPHPSSEDRITVYQYDLLNRLTTTINQAQVGADLSTIINLQANTLQYDVMDHIVSKKIQDLLDPKSASPDKQRSAQTIYDDWGQIIKETNPFIAQLLADIDANPDLTPEQKIEKKNDVLKKQSTRHQYDATGLKLSTTNSLDQKTVYYYDIARRPIISIDPKGIVKEITLDNFNNSTKVRRYYTKLAPEILNKLTGGFITAEVRVELDKIQNNEKDSINYYERNLRGLVSQQVGPEGYFSLFEYNAFKECEKEFLPVNLKDPTLKIEHEFEQRGLETKTTKTSGNLKTEGIHEYNNPLGKETAFINEVKAGTNTDHDRLGRAQKISQSIEEDLQKTHILQYTAFNQLKSDINSLNQETTHDYNQIERTHTIKPPIAGTETILTENVFGETIKKMDGERNTITSQHAPNGKVQQFTDALHNTTTDIFDTLGQNTLHQDADGVLTASQFNASGFLTEQIVDADPQHFVMPAKAGIQDDKIHLNLKTTFTRNSFGDAEDTVDPNNIHHSAKFDRRSLQLETSLSLGNAKPTLITQKTYNGQRQQVGLVKGDNINLNQYDETTTVDGLARITGNIIDPNGLAITSQQKLDGIGRVVTVVDPRSTDAHLIITRKFYNDLNKLRFEVDPTGSIKEWRYDLEGREVSSRQYAKTIDPKQLNDQTTLQMVAALAAQNYSAQDTLSYLFYDANGREILRVNSLGPVIEKRYNNTSPSQVTEIIAYAAPFEISQCRSISTTQLLQFVKTHTNSLADRHTYFILDAEGQQRFVIDPKGYVIEQVFDNKKRIISKKLYATPVPDPASLAHLTPEEFAKKLILDPDNDRVAYNVFDARDKPIFTVNGVGEVTRYDHDNNGNPTQLCIFANPIVPPTDYKALVALLQTLTPHPDIDNINKTDYDTANRIIQKTDALKFTDQFKLDALNNITQHIDRCKALWENEYDRINRKIIERTPFSEVTFILRDHNTGNLIPQTQIITVEKKTEYDAASNITSIIAANKTPEARTFKSEYDDSNRLQGTTIPQAILDDPTKLGNFVKLPEKRLDISTKIIYDGRGLPIAVQNENGQWSFKVFDASKYEIYQIDAKGAITETQYNVFREPIKNIRYANPLTIDFIPYIQTGIPISLIADNIVPSKDDRISVIKRDLRGDPEEAQTGDEEHPLFYYSPAVTLDDAPVTGRAVARTQQHFNAFHEPVYTAQLINPKLNSWKEKVVWNDRDGKLLAVAEKINKVGEPLAYRVTRYQRNANGQPTSIAEYENLVAPTKPLTEKLSLAELDKLIIKSDKDRVTTIEYNQRYNKTKQTILNAIVFKLNIDPNGVPQLVKLPPQNFDCKFQYNGREQHTSTIYEDGSQDFRYFNAAGFKIAETGVPRKSFDENGKEKTLIPLTYYGLNPFGQCAQQINFKEGTQNVNPNIVPQPVATSDEDQQILKLFTDRGKLRLKQDAEQNLEGFTYTPTDEKAREYASLTNWVQNPDNSFTTKTHIDETQNRYDEVDNLTQIFILRDGQMVQTQTTAKQFNAFREAIAEGPGDGTWPLQRVFNALGLMKTCEDNENDDKVFTKIFMRDLTRAETACVQSATQDLKNIEDKDLETLAATYQTVKNADGQFAYEFAETKYDTAQRVHAKLSPAYFGNANEVQPLPLSVVVGDNYPEIGPVSLSWAPIQETNVTAYFSMKAVGSDEEVSLKIVPGNGRFGVDVTKDQQGSKLSSDVYNYSIDYWIMDPLTNQPIQKLYSTQGTVQTNTGDSENSLNLVAQIEERWGARLYLTGNTQNLTGVELCKDGKKIADVPVQPVANSTDFIADLNGFASGEYTVRPIINNQVQNQQTLPFTIHTQQPSSTPLSQEIVADVFLDTLDTHGQLVWLVPPAYAEKSVRFNCEYIGVDGNQYTHSDVIAWNTDKGHYVDQNGKTLVCNTEFEQPIKQVLNISLAVPTEKQEWLPLLITQNPTQLKKKKMLLRGVIPGETGLRYFDGSSLRAQRSNPEIFSNESGFEALNVTREKFVETLSAVKNNHEKRKFLLDEIQAAFTNGKLTPPSLWEYYQKDHLKAQQELKEVIQNIKQYCHCERSEAIQEIEKLNTEELITWLENHDEFTKVFTVKQHLEQLADVEKRKNDYAESEDVFAYYLEAFNRNLSIGYHSAALYAELVNIKLVFWQTDPANPTGVIYKEFPVMPARSLRSGQAPAGIQETNLSLRAQRSNPEKTIHLLQPKENASFISLSEIEFNEKNPEMNTEDQDDLSCQPSTPIGSGPRVNSAVREVASSEEQKIKITEDGNLSVQAPEDVIQSYTFAPRSLLYISPSPFPSNVTPIALEFFDTSKDLKATWVKIPVQENVSEGILLDVTGNETQQLPPGYYPYRLDQYHESTESFVITQGNDVYRSQDFPEDANDLQEKLRWKTDPEELIHPVRTFERDRWDNVKAYTDALKNETNYEYNHRDQQITEISPVVDVYHDDGSRTIQQLTTITGFNERGFKVGVQKPRGNTRGYVVNEANQCLQDILGDGTIARTRGFDALNRALYSWDARGKQWKLDYNRKNKVTRYHYPSKKYVEYLYNERSHLMSVTDPGYGEGPPIRNRYNHDPLQNVEQRFERMGEWCQFQWDRNHQLTNEKYSDGTGQSWNRNYFGLPKTHFDLGGTEYTYIYDLKNQLISESCPGGNHGSYTIMAQFFDDEGGFLPFYPPTPGKNMTYRYRAGQLIEQNDQAQGQLAQYDLDAENHRVAEQLFVGGALARSLHSELDALNRDKITFDSGLTILTGYDENDNRRFTRAWLGTQLKSQRWNILDDADRVTIDGGILEGGEIKITWGQGANYSYKDASGKKTGFRETQQTMNFPHLVTANLYYNDDGLLTNTNDNTGYFSQRGYDVRGMTTSYQDNTTNQGFTYNENGWLIGQSQYNPQNPFPSIGSSYDNFKASGAPQGQETNIAADEDHYYSDVLTLTYVNFDTQQLAMMDGWRYDQDGKMGKWSSMQQYYDSNGNFNSVVGAQGEDSNRRKKILSKKSEDLLLLLAADKQRQGGYAVDEWEMGALSRGDIVYGGLPKPSSFYTTQDTIKNSELKPEKLFQSLQVKEDANLGYRSAVGKYEVTKPTAILKGEAKENLQHGSGGAQQYFIQDPQETLTLLERIPLAGEERDYLEKLTAHSMNHADESSPSSYGISPQRVKNPISDDDKPPTITVFGPGLNGNILWKYYYEATRPHKFIPLYRYYVKDFAQYYYTVNENYLGSWSLLNQPSVNYTKYITTPFGTIEVGPFNKGQMKGIALKLFDKLFQQKKTYGLTLVDPTPLISSTFPPPSGEEYTVAPGDDWSSIAIKTQGDPSWADALEAANNQGLNAEMLLTLPQFIPTQNNAYVHPAYNQFINLIIGSLYPHMDTPLPEVKHSFFSEVFHIAVDAIAVAVASVIAPGIGTALVGSSVLATLGGIVLEHVIAGVVAALVDAVGQELAIGMHIQSKFSFTEMAEVGIGEGIAFSASAANAAYFGTKVATPALTTQLLQAGRNAVADQLVNLAFTGKFDIRAVVEAFATVGLDNKMDAQLFGANTNASALENTVNNLANDVVDSEIEKPGRLNVENLAAQMIGAEVGYGVQTALEQEHLAEKAYEAAQKASQGQSTNVSSLSQTAKNANNSPATSSAQQKQTQTGKQKAQNWNQDAAKNNTKDWSDWNPLAISSMTDDVKEAFADLNTNAGKANATQPTTTSTATATDPTTLQQAQQQYGKAVGTLAYWLYHNRDTAYGKAILNGMGDFEKITSSAAYQDVINGMYLAADFGTSMIPGVNVAKGMLEELRGYNPVTGESVGRLGATLDTVFGLADLGGFAKLAEKTGMFATTAKEASIASKESALNAVSVTKHPLEGLTPEQVLQYAKQLGIKTPRDQFLLWSGLGKDGAKLAQQYAQLNGGITLEMTQGGKWLSEMDLFGKNSPFSPTEAYKIWESLSISAIRQASGQVRAVLGQVKPTNIYTQEVQELLDNDKILGFDELYIQPRYIFGK